jgi:hypothetical protein
MYSGMAKNGEECGFHGFNGMAVIGAKSSDRQVFIPFIRKAAAGIREFG